MRDQSHIRFHHDFLHFGKLESPRDSNPICHPLALGQLPMQFNVRPCPDNRKLDIVTAILEKSYCLDRRIKTSAPVEIAEIDKMCPITDI